MLRTLFRPCSQFTAMKLLILLLVVKKIFPLDITNGKIPGGWNFQDVMNHLHQTGYSGGYNIPGDTRRFQLGQQQQIIQQPNFGMQQQPNFSVQNIPNGNEQNNQICCPRRDCPNPCMSLLPLFSVPRAPVLVPLRAYYEEVVHDHPPVHKIKDIIERDEKEYKGWKKHRKHRGREVSCDEDDDSTSSESSDTETSSSYEDLEESSVDF